MRVIGVERFDEYSGCVKCRGKVVTDADDDKMGEYVKCQMMQCLSDCERVLTMEVMVKSASGEKRSLRVFDEAIVAIAETPRSEIMARVLVKAKPFAMVFSDGILRSISREV